jgi:hypothetical protein
MGRSKVYNLREAGTSLPEAGAARQRVDPIHEYGMVGVDRRADPVSDDDQRTVVLGSPAGHRHPISVESIPDYLI